MSDEIVLGYCKLCREYEYNTFGSVINEIGEKHYQACKQANCKHPVFYIADHNENKMISFPVEVVEKIFRETDASWDDLKFI